MKSRDLLCPGCGNLLPATAFEIHDNLAVEVTIDTNGDPQTQDEIIEINCLGGFWLVITCQRCTWWAEFRQFDYSPQKSIKGFAELSKLLVKSEPTEPSEPSETAIPVAGASSQSYSEYGRG